VIYAGEIITAAKVEGSKPKTYHAFQTSPVAAGSTNVLVPGCTVTFDTIYPNATIRATYFIDVDLSGASTTLASARLNIDGVLTGQFAVYQAEVITDRSTVGNQYRGVLPLAGSHTVFLNATTTANMTLNAYSSLIVEITEEVP
jgi:hypothetical protein